MHVLDNEEKEVLIVLVELYQLKQNIQICIAQMAAPPTHLRQLDMIDDLGITISAVLIDYYGAVNPNCELIEEFTFIRL
jgi:hypothetical protein